MPSTTPPPVSTTSATTALREHFANVVLPMWRGPGFNHALRLPYEALDSTGLQPAPAQRYRAMACARQLFTFSQAGDMEHARVLFDSLTRFFQDADHGGWFYSVDALGKPLDTTKDLYTHAFVVFACAEYARRSNSREALQLVHGTTAVIQSNFAADGGLFNAALNVDFSEVTGTPLQNPLMHLTEAWLAACEATRDNVFGAALRRLADAVARHFVHAPSGCIAELPIGASGNRLEPGHQFEWYWLVKQAGALFDGTGLAESLARAFTFAQQHGVDPRSGGVCASLDEAGQASDATQRIWAQTEYLRALAWHDDPGVRAALPQQIERFRRCFLHEHGWFECKAPTGEVARADMPSTTPYHLATAYAALPVAAESPVRT
ncbi:AGE family epimerase/isomerase [Paraburkholderia sp. MMS20-SJTN17]|uniref:AGE family epimerase/isomerase n=1 Tax=Paraburkholderia translucens TaxID=2886945 RepID=A0ABS8KMC7_9BURK|nr:AGE family epimerase/isomerase [Paraburkholderia sp. MMS20-SJTN17]MCC8405916.1 AGE family epimerase/isomerase [Paraburkholderia sp. MMS20-SJTN17]